MVDSKADSSGMSRTEAMAGIVCVCGAEESVGEGDCVL